MKPDSIIFDLDGTLWDVSRKEYKIWNTMMAERFPQLEKAVSMEEIRSSMGMTLDEIGPMLVPGKSTALYGEISRAIEEYEARYLAEGESGGDLYANTRRTLDILQRKYKLYIVSNCGDGYIEAFFATQNTGGYFRDWQSWARTRRPKGENIKDLMGRNGLTDAVYVGDTERDSVAARVAGIPFIYAAYGFGSVGDYDIKIDDIIELTDDNLYNKV